ncbi:hypothetical protein V8D89_000415 [Ganoderma adspersum]
MNSDRERGREAADEVRRVSELIYMLSLDLSNLRSVRRMVDELMRYVRKEPRLHVVVNNNYDLQFGVDALGNFYLTQFLLPVLLATAKATAQTVRVLHFSCACAATAGSQMDYTTLMNGPVRRRCTLAQLYRRSKLLMRIFSSRSSSVDGGSFPNSIAINPGNVHAGIARHTRGPRVVASISVLSRDVSRGLIAPLFAATSLLNGKVRGAALYSLIVITDQANSFLNILESILAHCAQAPAQMDCFERMNHTASSLGSLREHDVGTEFN